MRYIGVVIGVCIAFELFGVQALAQGAAEGTGGNDDSYSSGEAGARAGTLLYNSMNPDTPLPLSNGAVLQDTVRNMGSGQSPGDAYSNAARDDAGGEDTTPQVPSSVPMSPMPEMVPQSAYLPQEAGPYVPSPLADPNAYSEPTRGPSSASEGDDDGGGVQ